MLASNFNKTKKYAEHVVLNYSEGGIGLSPGDWRLTEVMFKAVKNRKGAVGIGCVLNELGKVFMVKKERGSLGEAHGGRKE